MTRPRRGRKWDRLARDCKARAGWRCEGCGVRTLALEAHHVVPVEDGGPWGDPDNLKSLCRGCHIAEHRRLSRPDPPDVAAWRKLADSTFG